MGIGITMFNFAHEAAWGIYLTHCTNAELSLSGNRRSSFTFYGGGATGTVSSASQPLTIGRDSVDNFEWSHGFSKLANALIAKDTDQDGYIQSHDAIATVKTYSQIYKLKLDESVINNAMMTCSNGAHVDVESLTRLLANAHDAQAWCLFGCSFFYCSLVLEKLLSYLITCFLYYCCTESDKLPKVCFLVFNGCIELMQKYCHEKSRLGKFLKPRLKRNQSFWTMMLSKFLIISPILTKLAHWLKYAQEY